MKDWWQSKTIYLMISELAGIWLLYQKEEIAFLAAILLSIQAAAGIILRFKTDKSIKLKTRRN